MSDICIACAGRTSGKTQKADAKDGTPVLLSCCESCGLVQLSDVPDQEELAQFYRDEYRKTFKNTDTPKPHHIFRAGVSAAERLSLLKPHVVPGQRLLDVGAGGGEFSYLAG